MVTTTTQHYDVIIVGAGIHGLCAAHTFLSINPSLSLLILDEKSTVGGVWAKQQIYPSLRANNLQGYYEFTDFPILDAGLGYLGVAPRSTLTGEALHEYVQKYAEQFDLLSRTRLGCRLVRARNDNTDNNTADRTDNNVWEIEVTDVGRGVDDTMSSPDKVQTIRCTKLIVATGQASRPLLPFIPGMQHASFGKPIIHSTGLGKAGCELIKDPAVSHVTVLGGSKSAHDAVYMFATAGKRVSWIIRPNGRGAMPMAKPYTRVGPWAAVWLEGLLMTRPLSWFGACPWSEGDGFAWVRGVLHRTSWGRWLVQSYFAKMTSETISQTGILQRERTKVLVPSQSLMWYGTQASILNYDEDFYAVVNDARVEIVRENIVELKGGGDIVLEDSHRTITTDALVCATGYFYTPTFPLEPSDKRVQWGVPVPVQSDNIFPALDDKADAQLFQQFPFLASSPAPSTLELSPGNTTPWQLWRFIAPPSQVCRPDERSLAFLCATTSYQTTIKAELTSLWTYAYLFNELETQPPPRNEADVFYEAALWSRYGKWRCPLGMQGNMADFLHDAMPFYDVLLRDLGLSSWRKKGFGVVLGEIFGGWYEVKDYRGIVDEWMANRKSQQA